MEQHVALQFWIWKNIAPSGSLGERSGETYSPTLARNTLNHFLLQYLKVELVSCCISDQENNKIGRSLWHCPNSLAEGKTNSCEIQLPLTQDTFC